MHSGFGQPSYSIVRLDEAKEENAKGEEPQKFSLGELEIARQQLDFGGKSKDIRPTHAAKRPAQ